MPSSVTERAPADRIAVCHHGHQRHRPVGGRLQAADPLPVLSAQAVRYVIGAAAPLAVARLRRQRLPRQTRRDLVWLLALGATGLAGFNILLLVALERAEPAAVDAVVGCVPVALAGPLLARRAPSTQVVVVAP